MMWLVPLLLAVLLASGLGLAYVVGGAAVVSFILTENERYLAILPQKVFSQISVFALLSMPLFILAGELMNRGGVTKALIDVSMAIVGRVRGGLGHVNIMTSVFFDWGNSLFCFLPGFEPSVNKYGPRSRLMFALNREQFLKMCQIAVLFDFNFEQVLRAEPNFEYRRIS